MQANLSDEEWATQIASLLRCPRLLIARKVGGMAKGANTPPPVDQEQAKADKAWWNLAHRPWLCLTYRNICYFPYVTGGQIK
jgi:hypothetical protein